MDGKIFVYLVCLAGIIGLIVFVDYSNSIDEGTQQVALTQQQVDSFRTSIRAQGELLELRKEVAALLKASDIMTKELDGIRDEIKELRDGEASLKRAFDQAVLQVRADSIGVVFPIVPLNNGTTLKNARVQSIEADIVTILHSEGVSKVPPENLPPDLQDRFRFGMRPGNSASTSQPQALRSTASLASSDMASTTTGISRNTATDNFLRTLAQQGTPPANDGKASKKSTSKKTSQPIADSSRETGDPALWNSVTRESLGRAYIPGQGWLEVGSNGPIPGTGRK